MPLGDGATVGASLSCTDVVPGDCSGWRGRDEEDQVVAQNCCSNVAARRRASAIETGSN